MAQPFRAHTFVCPVDELTAICISKSQSGDLGLDSSYIAVVGLSRFLLFFVCFSVGDGCLLIYDTQ